MKKYAEEAQFVGGAGTGWKDEEVGGERGVGSG
jgi:hypothetical protein